jgi:hypothetical protein
MPAGERDEPESVARNLSTLDGWHLSLLVQQQPLAKNSKLASYIAMNRLIIWAADGFFTQCYIRMNSTLKTFFTRAKDAKIAWNLLFFSQVNPVFLKSNQLQPCGVD